MREWAELFDEPRPLAVFKFVRISSCWLRSSIDNICTEKGLAT